MHGVDNSCVHVIDDDVAVLNALARLLGAAGLPVQTFASAKEFFAQHSPEQRGCLVLDLLLPGASGLEVQEALAASRVPELSVPTLGEGESYADLLADHSSYEDFDSDSYFGGRGFGFVRLQQLATEHLLGAR